MKITVAINRNYICHSGQTNIKIRVSHQGRTLFLHTPYYCKPKDFIRGRVRNDADINNKLTILVGQITEQISKVDIQGMNINSLMNYIRGLRTDIPDINSLFDEKIKTVGFNYASMMSITKLLIGRAVMDTSLRSINLEWLLKFEKYLRDKGQRPNTISINMRNVRTIYNRAIDLGLVDSYPFRRYKMPSEATKKRNLTISEICTIWKRGSFATDMFMLSFFLIGINMIDLFYLTKVEEGRVYYVRSKGKRHYSIKVQPEAQVIIDKYKGTKYLLNVLDRFSFYKNAVRVIDEDLKGIIDKPVSTYWSRHSWATIAFSIGISRDIIRYALGHANSITDIYIQPDLNQIDEANRKVITSLHS